MEELYNKKRTNDKFVDSKKKNRAKKKKDISRIKAVETAVWVENEVI
jgi:hypothetical protein